MSFESPIFCRFVVARLGALDMLSLPPAMTIVFTQTDAGCGLHSARRDEPQTMLLVTHDIVTGKPAQEQLDERLDQRLLAKLVP